MPGQTQVAGDPIKGRLSELRPFPRWLDASYYIVTSRQGSVFEVNTGLVEDGYRNLPVIGASIMHGST